MSRTAFCADFFLAMDSFFCRSPRLSFRSPIQPVQTRLTGNTDADFTLTFKSSRGRVSRHFFLEADRATMPGKRKGYIGTSIYKKLRGYWTWHTKHRAQVKSCGLPGFIVLTTTTTLERADNLRAIARVADDKQTGSHMFWFTAEDEYLDEPKQLLKSIWLSAGDELDSSRTHQLTESSHTTR